MTGPTNVSQVSQVPQLNTPSKPQVVGAVTGRNQKDRRYTDTFRDNHRHPVRFPAGRPWCGEREIAANTELMHEDGFVMPDLMQGEYVEDDNGQCDRAATLASSWFAPWRPLAKYFKFNYPKKTISFEYARMRLEEQQALDRYYEAAAIIGADLNVRVEYGVVPHFQITSKIGRPSKMVQIAEAAIAGDPWLLGFIDEPNMKLAEILGFNEAGLRVRSYTPPPIITPEQVIATPQPELMALLERLTAQVADLTADKQAREAKGKQLRAGKKNASQNLAEKPAA